MATSNTPKRPLRTESPAIAGPSAFKHQLGAPDLPLRNRLLVSSIPQRLLLDQVRAEDDDAQTDCYLPVSADRAELLTKLISVIRPLANKFDGYAPDEQSLKQHANAFLDKQI